MYFHNKFKVIFMFKLCLSMCVVMFFSGCISVPDPVVHLEKNITVTNAHPEKVLFVIDLSLEYPYIPSGLVYSKEDNMNDTYGKVAKEIVKRMTEQNISAEYILHSSLVPMTLPTSGYSHILVEKLDRFVNHTSSAGSYLSSRTWTAVLFEVTSASPLKQVYSQVYTSDGVDCFSIRQYASKEQCQSKYISLLLNHLVVIGVKNNIETGASNK